MPISEVERRGFGISDGLILIAGLAPGFALIKVITPGLSLQRLWNALTPPSGWTFGIAVAVLSELAALLVLPVLGTWTPACLLVQVLGKRPRWRQLRRRPGFVACLVATLVVVLSTAVLIPLSIYRPTMTTPGHYFGAILIGGGAAGVAVTTAWGVMGLLGACRPSKAWPDRLGRITGVAWILLGGLVQVFILYTT